jgi:hypothetical protein
LKLFEKQFFRRARKTIMSRGGHLVLASGWEGCPIAALAGLPHRGLHSSTFTVKFKGTVSLNLRTFPTPFLLAIENNFSFKQTYTILNQIRTGILFFCACKPFKETKKIKAVENT